MVDTPAHVPELSVEFTQWFESVYGLRQSLTRGNGMRVDGDAVNTCSRDRSCGDEGAVVKDSHLVSLAELVRQQQYLLRREGGGHPRACRILPSNAA